MKCSFLSSSEQGNYLEIPLKLNFSATGKTKLDTKINKKFLIKHPRFSGIPKRYFVVTSTTILYK